jgi:hypothetical protein
MPFSGLPTRFGTNDTLAAPDQHDLWLPVYGGEVLTAFEEMLLAQDIVRMFTITSGREMRFPQLHKMSAERHPVGKYMLGQDTPSGEKTIFLDDRPIVSTFELDDVDQAMSHFQVRSEFAKQAGQALARELDKHTLILAVNASRTQTDAGGSPFNGGGYKADPTAALDGTAWVAGGGTGAGQLPATATTAWNKQNALSLLKALEEIMVSWDERDIPQEDRTCVVPVGAWHALRNLGLPTDAATVSTIVGYDPFRPQPAGVTPDADPSRSQALIFNGFKIVRSNNLPNGKVIDSGEAKYQGDFTKTRAIAIQKQAVGMLVLMGIMTETERTVRKGVDFFGRMAA